MDKNTLSGLLLMGVIFFGFMYCNKPQQPIEQNTETTPTASTDVTVAVAPLDSLSSADETAFASAIKSAVPAQNGSYILKNETFDVAVDSTGVHGTVKVGDAAVDLASLRTPDAGNVDYVAAVTDYTARAQKYGLFAACIGGENTTTVLENENLRVELSSRGGMIKDVVLKDEKYTTNVGDSVEQIHLFRGAADGYSFIFNTAYQRFETAEFNFVPVVESDSAVVMKLTLDNGSEWGLRYVLKPDSYVVSMEVVQSNMKRVLPASTVAIDLLWHQTMARNEKGRTFEERNSAIHYKYVGEGPDDLNANKDDAETLNSKVKWVAFKNQFFSSVIIPRESFSSAELMSKTLNDDAIYVKDMTMKASVPYSAEDGNAVAFDFYFGPNDYSMLSDLDDQIDGDEDLELTHLIPLGWSLFRWINTLIVIPVFNFLKDYVSNFGIIILLLTIFIKLILFPFTFKSLKSQARMRLLAPEIKEINDKYPNKEDALKRQQETMDLYRRAGANPMSGCLPMLLQMPVLIAMFSFFPSAIELRGESFLWVNDLSAPDYILTLPFTIPFYGNSVSLFCLLMTVVNIVYMRITMQNQPGGSGMPGMQWMSYLMPVMFLFFFNDYASGLSYYYFLSLLITIVQTWIFRHCINEDKVRAEMIANAKKPRKKSGFMARLEAAQRQQQALQRQQAAAQAKKRR